jgi:hypothetical protein
MRAAVRAALAGRAREGARREEPRATSLRKWRRERHCSSVGDLGRLGDDLVETVYLQRAATCLFRLIAIPHYDSRRPLD